MANGADISRPPSASSSRTSSVQSIHPLRFNCTRCKAKHRRCDRNRPVCNTCRTLGLEAECLYPSAALAGAENIITKKTGTPFSGPMFNNDYALPALPTTGDKRPRAADSSSGRIEPVNDVVGLPIQNSFSHTRQTQILQQPAAKRYKISELSPATGKATSTPAFERGQIAPFGILSGSTLDPPPRMRSISPTLPQDEMELRCNLTTEINVQRMKEHRLTAGHLRNIIKLLTKAKTERPTTEPTIAGSSAILFDEYREEDDLMRFAIIKLKRGGQCSRALLSRFENFVYGPLMSPEEKKMQERVICVEECLSTNSASLTVDHTDLFLLRLKRIILHPDVYGLDENDPRIAFLRDELLTAMATDSKLSRPIRRKFAELLDPDGEIAGISVDNPGIEKESPESRKVLPKPTSSRVPSSHAPETPSRTITTSKQNSVTALSPSPSHPSLFPPLSLSTTHPPPVSSPISSLSPPPLETIDLTNDTMSSSFPFIVKRTPKKRIDSGSQSSQSNSTAASPFVEPASKKRPASGAQSSDLDNVIAPSQRRSAPSSQLFNSDFPKRLWSIFLGKQAFFLPILDLDQLKIAFNLAVNRGKIDPTVIDPTLGLCIAIACHLAPYQNLGEARKWFDAALSNMADPIKSRPSLQSFHHQILQVHYLHMVGHLRMAWDILSMSIGRAQSLRMQTMHGGCLAVDEKSLEQVRLVWQCLWTKKLFLTLQFGVVDQSLDSFYDPPMPMQSHITDNMGVSGKQTIEQSYTTSSFFIASASLIKCTDDLITVENDLRVTRMECPIKWLSIVDLRGFQGLNERLSSWKNGLPNCLEWRGPDIECAMQKDLLIRRMSLLAHVRFVYFRLRQYRPFFILSLRLSQTCACETSPHITGKDIDSVDASPVLGLVYYSAVKCLSAAQDIVKTLSVSFTTTADEYAKCEQLEYLYAAALILIAARTVPLVLNGTPRGISAVSAAATTAKSFTAMTEELKEIDVLLRNYQESCRQAPKLEQRIARSRDVLDQIKLQSESSNGIVTDSDIRLEPVIWNRIYDRLGLNVPFQRFSEPHCPAGSAISGRRKTLAWLESLPVDIDLEN
ncbi:transcriptional regulator family: Fungal Specific TF [Penicillium roqueforti]|uniref:transcriptional regulator family: Fungal Specific TF n=1 Tax=Penicillium roqueforti TaxID=5082 RepID=UPI0019092692|nr:transcriptional regulator family: Fungal Specific TF [Penicillium roqueforti]KAF9243043.1 transcriptional regulator family: Fungal Specific TF [Penicillium roqueforti]KAI1839009.1 transcriptional regulator family: Fungal Specific TF [Penicillium roqueforti]KAI2680808.1 transcriptional regulator family: Fungal Specific TF [Penicillium roqueforti]KAI2690802.1 transcriptional regulator family: Fungal Specific TF [Penicillium roqueforti]KAI2706139.1 transcriptional regulator family: Fungal Spec